MSVIHIPERALDLDTLSDVKKRSVAIVGGGIAGLTLGAALDPGRFDVTIHEAQPERTTGAALGLWSDARRALTSLGVDVDALVGGSDGPAGVDDVRGRGPGTFGWGDGQDGVPRDTHSGPARVSLHSLGGRCLIRVPGPPVAQVRRPDLMEALRERAPDVTAHRVDDPRDLDADIVVGADGVRSRVRGVIEPSRALRRATPWRTLRGIAPSIGGLDESVAEAREFWGAGRLFGDAPVRGGRYWFTAHRLDGPASEAERTALEQPENLDVPAVVREARARFVDAAPSIRATLDAADETTLATRLWTAPPLRRYVRGRYVVIGDSAHASLPNLARGASDAVVDAVTLARALEAGGSLTAWQARRVPVTQVARLAAGVVMNVATGFART